MGTTQGGGQRSVVAVRGGGALLTWAEMTEHFPPAGFGVNGKYVFLGGGSFIFVMKTLFEGVGKRRVNVF